MNKDNPTSSYEAIRERKELKFDLAAENNTTESQCPLCLEKVHCMKIHSHMKECIWWWEEVCSYPHVLYEPPPKKVPKKENSTHN